MKANSAQKDKYLTFIINNESYGVEISYIWDIIQIQKVTKVPDTKNYYKGVINLRGKVIPVIDVRLRFGIEEREYDERTCIVVVNIDEILTGLIVDRVAEVLNIPEDSIDKAISDTGESYQKFIKGISIIKEQVKIVLDIKKIIEDRANWSV